MEEIITINNKKIMLPVKLVLDEECIGDVVTPEMLQKYINSINGWVNFSSNRKFVDIWQYEDEHFYQITIPLSKDLSDYNQAIYDCVKEIAKIENENEIDVVIHILEKWYK